MMKVGMLCRKDVVTIREDGDLGAAAKMMREKHVGYLVVVRPQLSDGSLVPVGVVTDRDIVVKVLAPQADPRTLRVGDVMTQQPVVAEDAGDIRDALLAMRRIGVRRLPVVGSAGQLVGVLSLDDIIDTLAEELNNVAGSIRREQRLESTLLP
jgi:CBS domain-containing protein